MSGLQERDTQTRVKHEILKEYLIKWGSIITSGLKGHYARRPDLRPQFRARFVYVDYFAYAGIYSENNVRVDGSPILGVKALDEIRTWFVGQTGGLRPTTTAILFEEDGQNYQRLLDTLKVQGFTDRIKVSNDFSTLRDGDIAVIRGDSSQYVDQVLRLIDDLNPTYSFHFIDPYGTKGVERVNTEKIVSKKGADCIINMMLNPISRWISVATKDNLNPTEQAHAANLDKFYGSGIWREISANVASGKISRDEANSQLVSAFDAILRDSDNTLSVKQIPLQFQDRELILYYLFLTTHDPTGAFAMNEILADATIREYDLRNEKREVKRAEQTRFSFFDEITDEKRPSEPEADIDTLAEQIYASCRTKKMTFRDILREMIDSPYFQQDVREALGKLRTQGRASFEGTPRNLTNNSEVTFA